MNAPGSETALLIFIITTITTGILLALIAAFKTRQSKRNKSQRKEPVSGPRFEFEETAGDDDTFNAVIWDRNSVDLPSPEYLRKAKANLFLFCTTTGVKPDLSLIKPAIGKAEVVHWEYRTDNKINLQIALLLSLFAITIKSAGKPVHLHIFTTEESLETRFLLHARAYGINNITFLTGSI